MVFTTPFSLTVKAEAIPFSSYEGFFTNSIASPLYMARGDSATFHIYKINYELNGGTADNPVFYTTYSDSIILNEPKKEGYTFIGWLEDDDKYYIAHRGYSFRLPENTRISVQEAIDLGYSHIEVDVRFTSDGIPVVLHDDLIDRTARRKDGSTPDQISVKDITYDDLVRQYDFGLYKYEYSIEEPVFGSVPILTLDEFLNICAKNKVIPVIELKTGGKDSYGRDNLPKVAEALRKYDLQDKALIASGNLDRLKEMHDNYLTDAGAGYCVSLSPKILETRYENVTTINEFLDYLSDSNIEFIDYIGPSWKMITKDDFSPDDNIHLIKDRGFKVTTWTIDSTVKKTVKDASGNESVQRYNGEYLAEMLDVDSVYTDALLPKYSMKKMIPKGSTGNKTYRAMYKKNDRNYLYSVKFDGNGATDGSMKTIVDFHMINGIEHTITLSNNSYLKKGYQFTGWNTRKDGTGTAYENEDVYNMPNHDTVLYAQWKKIPDVAE